MAAVAVAASASAAAASAAAAGHVMPPTSCCVLHALQPACPATSWKRPVGQASHVVAPCAVDEALRVGVKRPAGQLLHACSAGLASHASPSLYSPDCAYTSWFFSRHTPKQRSLVHIPLLLAQYCAKHAELPAPHAGPSAGTPAYAPATRSRSLHAWARITWPGSRGVRVNRVAALPVLAPRAAVVSVKKWS